MERIPEPELMEGPEQAQAYAGADFSEAHENIVMEFCARFPGVEVTGEVLDLGCGPGDITFRFASKFPRARFFGVDGSGEMIRLAEERKGREQVLSRRITFIRGSIPGASIPNLGYEAIISNSLLHHLRRPEVLWETVVEYARPGTIIYIADLLRPESTGEARRLVEEGIRVEGDALVGQRGSGAAGQAAEITVGARVRLESGGTGECVEVRSDGKMVVAVGAVRVVTDSSTLTVVPPKDDRRPRGETGPLPRGPAAPLEIDLRGMTGDEAEMATLAAVDAAVLSEQPYLRIIHGMGTGVVRERVQGVVSKDRRVSRYAFAPRNQGGTGVTIVEFSA